MNQGVDGYYLDSSSKLDSHFCNVEWFAPSKKLPVNLSRPF